MDVYQVGTVDAEEVCTQEIFPLADGGLVAEASAFGGIDRDFFVVGFDVEDFVFGKGYGPAVILPFWFTV